MPNVDEIFRCPVTGRPLRRKGDVYVPDGETKGYRIVDGIVELLPDESDPTTPADTIKFYDSFGWEQDSDGEFNETHVHGGTNHAQLAHTGHCISRLAKYFDKGGDFIVDVGSGPIAHPELLSYGVNFGKRICIDLSVTGLRKAQQKLGDRGVYVRGDITKLPLADGSADAVTCNHLIYQLPARLQMRAFLELWRVLKPGGVAVIVYRWQYSGIAARLEKLAAKLSGTTHSAFVNAALPTGPTPGIDEPQPRKWFEEQPWPFAYTYDCYRLVDNEFMSRYVSDDWRGRLFLNALLSMQYCLPLQCGRYGAFPAIIVRKPALN
jgi:SAM-dependent methyltransferase